MMMSNRSRLRSRVWDTRGYIWAAAILGWFSMGEAGAAPAETPVPQPFSFAETSLQALRKELRCERQRTLTRNVQPSAVSECLRYTTADIFRDAPPRQGFDLVPHALGAQVEASSEGPPERGYVLAVDEYFFPPEEHQRIVEPCNEKCRVNDEKCTGECAAELLSERFPRQAIVLDGPSNGRVWKKLGFRRYDAGVHATYFLSGGRAVPGGGIDTTLLVAAVKGDGVESVPAEERRTVFVSFEGYDSRYIDLRNIPRLKGFGDPLVQAVPFPRTVDEISETPSEIGYKKIAEVDAGTDRYQSADKEYIVVLRSTALRASARPAVVYCDSEQAGNYFRPVWQGIFLVRDGRWRLLFDQLRDRESELLTTITFTDLNRDGRLDMLLGQADIPGGEILTSKGRGFEKWSSVEYSACGC